MITKHIATLLSSLVIGVWILGFAAPLALAQTCTTQYGGTTTCVPSDLTINKQVKHPTSGVFVENLGVSDTPFGVGSDVLFRLTIRNGSGETFNPVTVKDVLPEHLTFVAGPGVYDSKTRTLTYTLTNLIAGETRVQEILAKVVSALPQDKSLICEQNLAEVSALNRKDDDTSQVCMASKVMGTTTLPVAGFDDLLLILPFIGTALGGFAMLRKGRRT